MNEAQRLLIQSWLIKSQHDLSATHQLILASTPLLDIAIYHCQQSAEKAIKAFLTYHNFVFQRTHDIESLIYAASAFDVQFSAWAYVGRMLTPYATSYRYPADPFNMSPTQLEFDQALDAAQKFYDFVLTVLPSSTHPL